METALALWINDCHGNDLAYDGVQIEFLPPNTTSLIQPMDQGVIRAFKALYTRNTLQHLVDAMDSDQDFSLKDYWPMFATNTKENKDSQYDTFNIVVSV
uniref:DDE-1 domain-containing protein n=1 Tax=Fundulus heteroclitus TaxID=8078 RepID=A0A3Q2NRZ8_FUNHE